MNISFLSQWMAEDIKNPRKNWSLISIREKGDKVKLSDKWASVLEIEFDDLVPEECEEMPDRVAAIMGRKPDFFDKEGAKKIINFAENINNSEDKDTIIIHCHAGVSRSGAVAKFLCEKYGVNENQKNEAYNPHVYKILKEQ